jgi:glucokinase
MVVSTGVGGGLVLDGRLYPGPTGNAGHIGHISVAMDGDPCPCGSRGCLEVYASGPSITTWATRNGWRPPHGEAASAAAVATAANDGDEIALAAFRRAGRALAAAIAATAALVEIRLVVIGGGVAQSGSALFTPLREQLADYATLAFTRDVEIRAARLGTEAGLVGAAALALARRSASPLASA